MSEDKKRLLSPCNRPVGNLASGNGLRILPVLESTNVMKWVMHKQRYSDHFPHLPLRRQAFHSRQKDHFRIASFLPETPDLSRNRWEFEKEHEPLRNTSLKKGGDKTMIAPTITSKERGTPEMWVHWGP